jgi:hypothetical protein
LGRKQPLWRFHRATERSRFAAPHAQRSELKASDNDALLDGSLDGSTKWVGQLNRREEALWVQVVFA